VTRALVRLTAAAAALAALAAAWSAPAAAQSPAPTPTPFRVEVDVQMVSITAVVHDKAGRFVSGLTAGDVEVREDGVVQPLAYFHEARGGAEKIPLSVVLVLDTSGSMDKSMRFLQEAASTFVHKMEDGDRALLVSFNNSVKASAEFTPDEDRLDQFIESLQPWGGTSLYDATHYALNRVRDEPGRKAVIVFSDGADTTSQMKEQEVIDYARAVEATVYGIGFRGESGLFARGPRGFLRRLAQETGGDYFFPDKVGELIRVFSGISEELHRHYALAYAPTRTPDGSWRKLDLAVKPPKDKDVTVRIRKGYFAVKRKR
jgi:Ca-activated chloride channel family protein